MYLSDLKSNSLLLEVHGQPNPAPGVLLYIVKFDCPLGFYKEQLTFVEHTILVAFSECKYARKLPHEVHVSSNHVTP